MTGFTGPVKVRLLADHAGSPIWFPEPIPLEATGLGDDLVAELAAWAARVEALTEIHPADELEATARADVLDDAAIRLARRIAAELGAEFEVEFRFTAAFGRDSPPTRSPATGVRPTRSGRSPWAVSR